MSFKATIKAGLAEVSTTECSDLELVTPGKHTIHGATAVYAYDRLHELVGKHCLPGTPRGDGKADEMGRALGQVLENQLGVIGRQEREIERLKRELRAVGAQCEPFARKPAPAVTKDTPVTLGMLWELNARGDVLWNKRYGTNNSTETVMGLALAEKLGGH